MPVVPAEDRLALEEEISLEEVQKAITKLKAEKMLGLNGLPAEFYNRYPGVLGPYMLDLFKEVQDMGGFPPNLQHATIAMIHKKGKPDTSCGFYHPI
ncbi:hypothetical protein NDU88_005655 [Pleurodeles waltl]|uniref:Uncharacterized protein n=1 Tax=Pleurodeles waltl TaxID=8319 RepID=A0AAV7MHK5_PLEWA|nr:hypothetical protein NDU88_005655 [Pleurodeles waltl]